MLKRFNEIKNNRELRGWLFWRFTHPKDGGILISPRRGIPPYLEGFLNQTPNSCFEGARKFPELPHLMGLNKSDRKPQKLDLNLAGAKTQLDPDRLEEFFRSSFADDEDNCALHRFAWLLPLIAERSEYSKVVERLIQSWILDPPFLELDSAWEAYSIAERLANWGIFLCRSRCHQGWSEEEKLTFLDSIRLQAQILISKPEYFGEKLTGNHLSNNGRGLLWAALLCGDRYFAQLGSKIVQEELKRVIQPHGVLREGSSHYQFLITRNYWEAAWLAEQLDLQELKVGIFKQLPLMASACRFLVLQGIHPHIGDISPDFPPEWFEQVPDAVEAILGNIEGKTQFVPAQGWAAQFFKEVPRIQEERKSVQIRDDFARLDQEGFSILVHTNPRGYPILPGHAHRDSGCPVVVYQGRALLIDQGRCSYIAESKAAVSAWAHNSILIDDEELEVQPRGLFGPAYLQYLSGKEPDFKADHHGITSVHYGLKRFGVIVTRIVRVQNGILEILAEVEGQGSREITWLLHTLSENSAQIYWPERGSLSLQYGPGSDSRLGYRSTRYGEKLPCASFVWKKKVKLPWKGVVTVKP